MKLSAVIIIFIALIVLLTGCTTNVVIDRPLDEVSRQIDGMWYDRSEMMATEVDYETVSELPESAQPDPNSPDVSRRFGWLYDVKRVEENEGQAKYTVSHHFETSGAALLRARTVVWVKAISDSTTEVRVYAEGTGWLFSRRDQSREKWIIRRIVNAQTATDNQ